MTHENIEQWSTSNVVSFDERYWCRAFVLGIDFNQWTQLEDLVDDDITLGSKTLWPDDDGSLMGFNRHRSQVFTSIPSWHWWWHCMLILQGCLWSHEDVLLLQASALKNRKIVDGHSWSNLHLVTAMTPKMELLVSYQSFSSRFGALEMSWFPARQLVDYVWYAFLTIALCMLYAWYLSFAYFFRKVSLNIGTLPWRGWKREDLLSLFVIFLFNTMILWSTSDLLIETCQ